MEVLIHSKWQILRNFAGYLPLALFCGFVYFVFGSVGVIWLLEGHVPDEQLKPVALIVTAIIVALSGLLYVWFLVNRLSRCRFSLEGDTLVICGQTSSGFVERQYRIDQLEWIDFGEGLNAAERVMDDLHQLGVPKTSGIGIIKDLKAGRMLVTARGSGQEVFHFVDKVFELNSLSVLVAELRRRGVAIAG